MGLLPNVFANPLARLEPYGMMILIGLLILLLLVGSQLGVDLSFVSHLIATFLADGFYTKCDVLKLGAACA